jgi:hypothetical protein
VTKLKLGWRPLKIPLEVRNVDGTGNKAGNLTHYVKLKARIDNREEELTFYVTSLGRDRIILGYPWLKAFNPKINWRERSIRGNVELATCPIWI